MPQETFEIPVAVTGYLVQAACALVIALVLATFHRSDRQEYLRNWAWSWWAACVYMVATAVAHLAPPRLSGEMPWSLLLLLISCVSLVAAGWQVVWLLAGTYEVTSGQEVPRRRLKWLLLAVAALALAAVAGALLTPQPWRQLIRVGVRSFAAALAFLIAGLGVLRSRGAPRGLGRKLVAISFLLYGAQQMHYGVLQTLIFARHTSYPYRALLHPLDTLLMGVMGLGMVIWLLEEERIRAVVASKQIAHLAHHDSLTELANRNLFFEQLRLAVARARAGGLRVAVFLLDLDRFKSINDSLGHGQGDEVLKMAAKRLRGHLRPADTVARLGGDEFAVLLPAVGGERDILRLADKVLHAMRRPLGLAGREIVITASLGISRFPEDGADPEQLLKKADVAMYRAKEAGRDVWQLYAASMDAGALDLLSLENDLRKAVAGDELVLHYQPVLDAQSGRIEAVEALLRWPHPVRGMVLPGDFLGIAEQSGLSNTIDLQVLRSACRELRSWHDQGADWLRVAVNLTARSFQRADLVERVKDVLWETGLPSHCLEIEITETLAMQNAEESLAVLNALKELGVRIAIDDFGTGYSSLAYLRNFPIDTLKIDASFVRALSGDRSSYEIASAMIVLAHSLNIKVIAEGVEEPSQWQALKLQACDEVQGYLFSRPLPAEKCRELVAQGQHALLPSEPAAAEEEPGSHLARRPAAGAR